MAHADFVHLRVHTAYSLLEGAIKVPDLVKQCQGMHMPSVAMTDTVNLFGAMEFSGKCAEAGIQPIIGCQLALTPFRGTGEAGSAYGGPANGAALDAPDQLVVLAQNQAGFGNLLKLISESHLAPDGEGEPRLALETIEAHAEGLIALTGGPKGGLGRLLFNEQTEAAEMLLNRLQAAFQDRLYIEIMRHNLDQERAIEAPLLDLAYARGIPLVATNECFFVSEDMHEAHDALICIAEGAYINQTGRRKLTPEHRFKSPQEMRALFADLPEAIDNTLVIARRCGVMAEGRDPLLPKPPGARGGGSDANTLESLAGEGLEARLEAQIYTAAMSDQEKEAAARPYRERLEYELGVIEQMDYVGYFLIVADFIRWTKGEGIPVGPGRGSGAGSVAAWALTITDLDPLRFGLLFERFLNPERVSMPDFDIDFCQDRRDEVIRYVQGKYGADRVAQIITFGTLQPRAALRDVGRVLQMPYPQVDRICKLVPNYPASPVTLEQAIKGEPQLQQEIETDATVARLVEIAKKLEGLYRHASTHAAGVVIGDRPLTELIPLYRDPRSDIPVTQYSWKPVEAAGLVKFDFLGLKTLTVLATALKLMRRRGHEVDLAALPFDDAKTFELLGRGETTGVFQLESSGMRDILRNMNLDSFEDIIAIVSLYRPGPMDNIPSYINRTLGREEPDYLYPTLEPILKETYGIMIYQEQVMQIAQELAGYSLGGADILRRAMGKKDKKEMNEQRKKFTDGAVARGVPEARASEIFDQMAKFAGYGFNKSHAAAYALVAYQTAYLKANYPVEFMAASMTLDLHNTDKLASFKDELKRMNIPLLPPDINASEATFKVEETGDEKGAVRYALAALKNVGEGAMDNVTEARQENGPYASIHDFAGRMDSKVLNKRQLENLIRAGTFDALDGNRRHLLAGAEALIRHASAARAERESNQIGLFGDEDTGAADVPLPEMPDWLPTERLKEEFDAGGFYLSAHPLDAYTAELERLRAVSYQMAVASGKEGPVRLAGVINSKKERTSQKGNKYAFVQLSDGSGEFEVTVFSETLSAHRDLLQSGQAVFVKGSLQMSGESVRITVQSLEDLDQATARTDMALKVFIDDEKPLQSIKQVLEREKQGRGEVILISRLETDTEVEIRLAEKYSVSPAMAQAVKAIPGVIEVRTV
ncbi:MAG: DNA polymerase III subunit alpha [Rhodospirillaceae bacterium]|nr:DNA polymerase III subunit alpha [Rhodospirillaceae bacterium]